MSMRESASLSAHLLERDQPRPEGLQDLVPFLDGACESDDKGFVPAHVLGLGEGEAGANRSERMQGRREGE